MYNLLITAHEGAWEKGNYELDASRYLEYTLPDISQKFRPLSSNIENLILMPCLFAYEGTEKPYRFGRITKISNRISRIYIEYEFDINVQPIPYDKIESISVPLDIRDWEIKRTHWAVKDGDLIGILSSIGIEVNDRAFFKTGISKNQSSANETISTVTGFIQKIFKINKGESNEIFYRGHSNRKKFKLEPSLFRKDDFGNYLYLQNEDILFRELLVSNSKDFEGDTHTLDKLVRMQHYSLPTRMLDITSNPLISLYFSAISDTDEDGEVIVFTIKKDFIKYFDSDTASCIANLARLPQKEKDKIDYESDKFNSQNSIKRLVHLIREEKPFFSPNIDPKDLRKIICVKSKMTNNRIISQSGAFLLFGHESVMNEDGIEGIGINRILVREKKKILEELDSLNINERTVFPYIENSAKYVRNKFRVKY